MPTWPHWFPTSKTIIRASLRRTCADVRGQAFVELALLMPIFTLMLVGAAECARLAYASIEVSNAAHAGVQYGAQTAVTAANISGMKSAALADGPDITNLVANASNFCSCSNGTAITCSNAATTCTARIIEYVQVNTSATVSPTFHIPGMPSTYTLQGTAVMRVEQ